MSSASLFTSGDWDKAISYFRSLVEKLHPAFTAQIYEDGEFVLNRMREHIKAQDLGWTPLSPTTIELKGGNTTIYVETGTLFGSLEAKKLTSKSSGSSVIVGIPTNMVHKPSGRKMTEIMGWLEYGTDRMPPRPLIRPTFEEVQDVLKEHWKALFFDVVQRA